MPAPWWKSAVIYQVYPRSFADGDGDGIGDLAGLRANLDHLVDLGVDALWLSPFYRSPMADFGYDVSDHCDVDPVFGTLADADRLIAEAHERGLRVLVDWVPNHTSDQHAWFAEARSSRDSPKRDWYVWRDAGPGGGPPNDWAAAFVEPAHWVTDAATGERRPDRTRRQPDRHAGSAWTLDKTSGQWYLHLFLPEQPDVDWRQPALEAAMHDVLRFWLDRGVDGFRADVVHMIGKDPDAAEPDGEPLVHELLRRIRSLLDGYPGERMMVGEVYLLDTAKVASYYGEADELHLSFNFPPLYTRWRASAWRQRIDDLEEHFLPRMAWPTWVLSNHDNPRHRTRYGTEARARAAAVLMLGLRGTPFLYAGEELGLEDAEIPEDRVVDPGGRDGCRAPIPWSRSGDHGWGDEPWLPLPPDPGERSVEAQRDDPTSMLTLYRQVLAARRASPALTLGDQSWLFSGDDVLAWRRGLDGDERVVAVNFSSAEADAPVDGDWQVEVSSVPAVAAGSPYPGTLAPDEAVVLRPG